MNDVVSPFLRGGLGNYIFQIAAAHMVSKRDNKDLKVDYSDIVIYASKHNKDFNYNKYFTNNYLNALWIGKVEKKKRT